MRSRRATLFFFIGAIACRRDVARLDEVQKMAYGAKPAVVRVNAYATAEFRYAASTIGSIAEEIGVTQTFADATLAVPTGAGGSGTGFIINTGGLILTSGHVVAPTRDPEKLRRDLLRNGAIAALIKHLPIDELRRLHRDATLDAYVDRLASSGQLVSEQVVNEVELSNGAKHPFRVDRYSPALTERGNDLALLRIGRTNLPVLRLGDSDVVRVGDSIWSIGYPAVASSTDEVIGGWLSGDSDLEATLTPGTITAIKSNITKTPVFQSNVGIYRGNSGGPVVNRLGEVIGIATWGHTGAEQIKFLVPINLAKTMLTEAKVPANVEGQFNAHYRRALDAAGDGNWSLAGDELANASRFFPNSPDLLRFQRDASRALKETPMWRQHPVMAGAAACLMMTMIGSGVFFAIRRSRPLRDMALVSTVESMVTPGRGDAGALGPSEGLLRPLMLGKFTILNGNRAGERLGLGGSGIRIGRESTICEIVLENPKVSRLHAEVVSIDGKVLLIDRNSSNGTYVNDQKIDKRFLKDGDIIYFGGRNAVAVAFHA